MHTHSESSEGGHPSTAEVFISNMKTASSHPRLPNTITYSSCLQPQQARAPERVSAGNRSEPER